MKEAGLKVDWYFRPGKVKHLSFSKVLHNLFLTRFLVAANRWASDKSGFDLLEVRTCYDLGKGDESTELGEKENLGSVIPDAWLLFERRVDKAHFPVLLEIDRGTAYRQNFKRHVGARLEYIKAGGEYSRIFGEKAVRIAYATGGENPEYRQTRRRSMCTWTMEVLREQGREKWASLFRFCSLSLEEMYKAGIFEKTIWYRPDAEKPVKLVG